MARPQTRPLVDAAFGGKLDEHLIAWRSEGLSWDAIARRIERDQRVVVSSETVRKWLTPTEATS